MLIDAPATIARYPAAAGGCKDVALRGAGLLVAELLALCPRDYRRDLQYNILCTGGATLFDNYPDALQSALSAHLHHPRVKIIAAPERFISEWIGVSIIASLSFYQCMTKEDWHEFGPAAPYRFCDQLTDQRRLTNTRGIFYDLNLSNYGYYDKELEGRALPFKKPMPEVVSQHHYSFDPLWMQQVLTLPQNITAPTPAAP